MCIALPSERLEILPALIAAIALSAAAGPGEADVDADYRQAVRDAAFAEQDEVVPGLIRIDEANRDLVWSDDGERLLVATWKAQGAFDRFLAPYEKTSDNPDYAVWVTAVPQVQRFCRAFISATGGADAEALDLRLKQYLGLSPDWRYDVFVEMWVDPDDLFRPCVDPETDDTACELQPGDETPTVTNIADYRDFYADLYYKSFRASDGVPWTGLGYTYDWGNPDSEVGASEFILVPEAPYEIVRAVPTMEYCRTQPDAPQ